MPRRATLANAAREKIVFTSALYAECKRRADVFFQAYARDRWTPRGEMARNARTKNSGVYWRFSVTKFGHGWKAIAENKAAGLLEIIVGVLGVEIGVFKA